MNGKRWLSILLTAAMMLSLGAPWAAAEEPGDGTIPSEEIPAAAETAGAERSEPAPEEEELEPQANLGSFYTDDFSCTILTEDTVSVIPKDRTLAEFTIPGQITYENVVYTVTEVSFSGCLRMTSFVAVSYTHLDVYKRQDVFYAVADTGYGLVAAGESSEASMGTGLLATLSRRGGSDAVAAIFSYGGAFCRVTATGGISSDCLLYTSKEAGA